MKIKGIRTPIVQEGDDLEKIISESVSRISEQSVLVVTSKIISYAQGRLIAKDSNNPQQKQDLIQAEADQYLPQTYSQYGMTLSIKNHTLTVNAGVDESNANGKYVLWPQNLQESANQIWQFLRQHYQVQQVGVVISDSRTWPLRWGVVGTCLVHCGFKQLADYRGKKDLFGRKIKFVQLNIAEAIASAAVLEMGEVAEQTPLALVERIKHIEFQDREPSQAELETLQIKVENDVYGPFLKSVPWVKK